MNKDSDMGKLYAESGWKHEREGDCDLAVSSLKTAIEHGYDPVRGYTDIARIYSDRGLFDEAVRELKESLKKIPGSPEIHRELGRAYYGLGKYREAMTEYAIVLESDQDNQEASSEISKICMKLGDFSIVSELGNVSGMLHAGIGAMCEKKGDYPSAVRELEKAIDKGFSSCEVYMRLGRSLRETGDSAGSTESFKKAGEAG